MWNINESKKNSLFFSLFRNTPFFKSSVEHATIPRRSAKKYQQFNEKIEKLSQEKSKILDRLLTTLSTPASVSPFPFSRSFHRSLMIQVYTKRLDDITTELKRLLTERQNLPYKNYLLLGKRIQPKQGSLFSIEFADFKKKLSELEELSANIQEFKEKSKNIIIAPTLKFSSYGLGPTLSRYKYQPRKISAREKELLLPKNLEDID